MDLWHWLYLFLIEAVGFLSFPSSQDRGAEHEALAERKAKRNKDKADLLGQM